MEFRRGDVALALRTFPSGIPEPIVARCFEGNVPNKRAMRAFDIGIKRFGEFHLLIGV